jgi:hypothetical protein
MILLSEDINMKTNSTLFLRIVILALALPILALCIFVYPVFTLRGSEILPEFAYLRVPYLIALYIASLLYFYALYQGFRLLNYIDSNKAFSNVSVYALRNIKYSALMISLILFTFMPIVFHVAQLDDAPGLIIVGAAFMCIPLVVSVFAALLEKLLNEAIQIKVENELTV